MKLKFSALLLTLLCFPFLAQGEADSCFVTGIRDLEARLSGAMVVSFGNFTYQDKEIGSSFSKYLESRLGQAMQDSPLFEFFAKDKLEEILEAAELSLSDLSDPEQQIEVGKLKSIQGLITGRFFDDDEEVQVFLELLDVESGTVIGRTELHIPRADLPDSVSIRPDNYSDALYVLEQLSEVQNAGNQDFVVKVWTSRGNGGTYRDGEKLVINFFSNRDCYVKVYHIDARNSMQLIFPNPYFSDNFVTAKKVYKIPDSRYPFAFVLGEPYGTEFIKVMASTVQFTDIEESFEDLGTPSRGLASRGLSIKRTDSQVTEAIINYTIIE